MNGGHADLLSASQGCSTVTLHDFLRTRLELAPVAQEVEAIIGVGIRRIRGRLGGFVRTFL